MAETAATVLSEKTDVPQVLVLPVDPLNPPGSMLLPFISQRIFQMAEERAAETDAGQTTRSFMARLWARDPKTLVLMFLEPNGKLVGHVTAEICSDGVKTWVFCSQCKADGNVGDAVKRALLIIDEWAKQFGATNMTIATHRNDAAWQRKYGLENHRSVLLREVGSPVGKPPAD